MAIASVDEIESLVQPLSVINHSDGMKQSTIEQPQCSAVREICGQSVASIDVVH